MSDNIIKKIVCFGEVLWDILPTESIAGGAPMNVSIRLQSLGIQTKMISKIGNDTKGKELLKIIKNKNVDISLIQIDKKLSTGEVLVHLDNNGSASYDIVYPTAWDKIKLTDENLKAVQESDALIYGSLACRDEISKQTLLVLLKEAKFKIFDVNLRQPYYSIPFIKEMMDLADFVKFNDEELLEVSRALGSTFDAINDNILFISKLTNTNAICVTKGKDGAVLYIENQFYSNKGIEVKVADTIGAGDSFLAALLSKALYTKDYNNALAFGCVVGALVASRKGANPELSLDEINSLV